MKNLQRIVILALGAILVSVTATPNVLAGDCEILEAMVRDRGISGVKILRLKEISDARSDEVSDLFGYEMWISYFDLEITVDSKEHQMVNEKVLIRKDSNYRRSQLIDLAKGIESKVKEIRRETDPIVDWQIPGHVVALQDPNSTVMMSVKSGASDILDVTHNQKIRFVELRLLNEFRRYDLPRPPGHYDAELYVRWSDRRGRKEYLLPSVTIRISSVWNESQTKNELARALSRVIDDRMCGGTGGPQRIETASTVITIR